MAMLIMYLICCTAPGVLLGVGNGFNHLDVEALDINVKHGLC